MQHKQTNPKAVIIDARHLQFRLQNTTPDHDIDFYLPVASSHTWLVLHGRARGRPGALHRGTGEGTSQIPAAAGCGGTRCGLQALQRKATMSFPGKKQELVSA